MRLRIWLPAARAQDMVYEYGLVPARYSRAFLESRMLDPGTFWERAVPFVSYMGLHNDWTHLVINCLFLLAFAPIVARRFGPILFLVFFIVCGIAGALTYLAFNWGSPAPVVGASGAISGLMAAALRMLPGQSPWAMPGAAPLAPIFSRQMLVFTADLGGDQCPDGRHRPAAGRGKCPDRLAGASGRLCRRPFAVRAVRRAAAAQRGRAARSLTIATAVLPGCVVLS